MALLQLIRVNDWCSFTRNFSVELLLQAGTGRFAEVNLPFCGDVGGVNEWDPTLITLVLKKTGK